jgi:hypothetical protein
MLRISDSCRTSRHFREGPILLQKRFLVLERRTFFPTQVQVENIDS